ncbi:hypothetical protein H5410_018769 [Solanum commersonii]|uniref:Uncharacterized protein n=1 Tax=Solanum commersonii TaxID=4109 RepID=A0A9J6A338_SOLCO|nr:hypothetical protein H5410_018769 [Solanum commersonii]
MQNSREQYLDNYWIPLKLCCNALDDSACLLNLLVLASISWHRYNVQPLVTQLVVSIRLTCVYKYRCLLHESKRSDIPHCNMLQLKPRCLSGTTSQPLPLTSPINSKEPTNARGKRMLLNLYEWKSLELRQGRTKEDNPST